MIFDATGYGVDGYPSEDILIRPLALAHYLLDGVQTLAQQLSVLGDIDLPPILQPAADVSHLQTAAPLYLASELEAARLIPAVEILAGLFAEGGLRIEDETAARGLYRFWQNRHNRFSQEERKAFFSRLFGAGSQVRLATEGSRNRSFEIQMAAMAEAISALEPDPIFGSRPVSDAGLAAAASRLAANVAGRSGGIAAYAARDIMTTVEAALSILKLRPIQVAVGAISAWTAVDAVATRYLRETVNIRAHVERGRSGMLLLTWLAEQIPALNTTAAGGRLDLAPPIYDAAATWLQATRELRSPEYGGRTMFGSSSNLQFPASSALVSTQG